MDGAPPQSITPNTHVRLTLTLVVSIVGSLILGAATATAVVIRWTSKVDDHMANEYVHPEPDFVIRHGHLVGTYDLDQALRDVREAAKAEKEAVDQLTLSPLHFEDCEVRGRSVTCRWRH